MEKADIKACQIKLMKLKGGGYFVYHFDKADRGGESQGHNLVITRKSSEAMIAYRLNKKKDKRIARGTFIYDPQQVKFLFGLTSGDAAHLQKGMRKLAGMGAPLLRKIELMDADTFSAAQAEVSAPVAVAPTPLTGDEQALLDRLRSGEELNEDEMLAVLGLNIEQEILDTFDQAMLDGFLSLDMSAEEGMPHAEAFSSIKNDFRSAKQVYNNAIQAVHRDIKAQAQQLMASLTAETPTPERTAIEETVALARSNRSKLKSSVIGSTDALEDALDSPGTARSTIETELSQLIDFISNDPIVTLVRSYPYISVNTSLMSCRIALEKMHIQLALFLADQET